MLTTTYKLIQEDSVLVTQPILIQHYGRVGASLIQQIYYWSQKGQGVMHDNQRWIHNTAEQWAEQLCVSASTIKRTVKNLLQDGAICVLKLSKHKSNQTNSYTLNLDRLQELMEKRRGDKEDFTNESNEICKNSRKAHRVKMTPSSGQNEPMVIQRLTHKNKTHKSRDFVHPCEEKKHESSKDEVQQVQATPEPVSPALASSKLTSSENIQFSCVEGNGHASNESRNEEGVIRKTTAQDMVDIWNKEVSINKETHNVKLNRDISKYLVASFKYKFNEDLDDWKKYCRLIASSPYLMGKGFNLSLTWALKFATIDRILSGELGVQGLRPVPEQPRTEEELRAEALRHIEGVGESQGCKDVRRMILQALGAGHYNAWFTQVDILDDGKTLRPHNRFVEAAIQARFGDVLERVGR